MSLFTVEINTKRFVTKYLNKAGTKFEQYEENIRQVYHDLPLATAQGYKKLDPAALITEQALPVSQQKMKITGEYHTRGYSTAAQNKGGFRRAEPKEHVENDGGTTLIKNTGTYGDLVNTMIKDAA